MARFLIEVPHNDDFDSCVKAVSVLLSTGSHFLTNADWGCSDGEHKAWAIVDVDTKEEALSILPPSYRAKSKVVQLNKFTMEEMDKILYQHNSIPVRPGS